MRRILMLMAMASCVLAGPALAHEDECSPGYWKNHVEVWDTECCADEACVDLLLENLKARGPGSRNLREGAADFLKECLGDPCND